MAASGRGNLSRPYQPSKSHNFVVAGLILVLFVLGYNYWSTSVARHQQTYEISILQTSVGKLKHSHAQLQACKDSYAKSEVMRKKHEDTVSERETTLADTRQKFNDLAAQHNDVTNNLATCNANLQQRNDELRGAETSKRELEQSCIDNMANITKTCEISHSDTRQEFMTKLDSQYSQNRQLQQTVDDQLRQISELQTSLKEVTASLEAERSRVKQMTGLIPRTRSQPSDYEQSQNQLFREVKRHSKRFRSTLAPEFVHGADSNREVETRRVDSSPRNDVKKSLNGDVGTESSSNSSLRSSDYDSYRQSHTSLEQQSYERRRDHEQVPAGSDVVVNGTPSGDNLTNRDDGNTLPSIHTSDDNRLSIVLSSENLTVPVEPSDNVYNSSATFRDQNVRSERPSNEHSVSNDSVSRVGLQGESTGMLDSARYSDPRNDGPKTTVFPFSDDQNLRTTLPRLLNQPLSRPLLDADMTVHSDSYSAKKEGNNTDELSYDRTVNSKFQLNSTRTEKSGEEFVQLEADKTSSLNVTSINTTADRQTDIPPRNFFAKLFDAVRGVSPGSSGSPDLPPKPATETTDTSLPRNIENVKNSSSQLDFSTFHSGMRSQDLPESKLTNQREEFAQDRASVHGDDPRYQLPHANNERQRDYSRQSEQLAPTGHIANPDEIAQP